jgi:hypothetical protein
MWLSSVFFFMFTTVTPSMSKFIELVMLKVLLARKLAVGTSSPFSSNTLIRGCGERRWSNRCRPRLHPAPALTPRVSWLRSPRRGRR